MAPYTNVPLSPAELSYIHTSLANHTPPIRPDGRSPTQFRPLVAEADILPLTNGSARVCFADGSEAVVGVKAQVQKRRGRKRRLDGLGGGSTDKGMEQRRSEEMGGGQGDEYDDDDDDDDGLEVTVEIPGLRDDDTLPVFLGEMVAEAIRGDGKLGKRLGINAFWRWTLAIDILLLSQPLAYPLPLLSLTTHLALLNTRLPALVSQEDEDPLFDDDWEASTHLYPLAGSGKVTSRRPHTPPVTLLVMAAGNNILFDPSRDELAVADCVLAISLANSPPDTAAAKDHTGAGGGPELRIVAVRTVDAPSRITAAGVPRELDSASRDVTGASVTDAEALVMRERDEGQTVWRPPRGGVRRDLVASMIKMVLEQGGVGEEVMEGLAAVET